MRITPTGMNCGLIIYFGAGTYFSWRFFSWWKIFSWGSFSLYPCKGFNRLLACQVRQLEEIVDPWFSAPWIEEADSRRIVCFFFSLSPPSLQSFGGLYIMKPFSNRERFWRLRKDSTRIRHLPSRNPCEWLATWLEALDFAKVSVRKMAQEAEFVSAVSCPQCSPGTAGLLCTFPEPILQRS